MSGPALSVVVPVRDEAVTLPRTVPALLAAAEGAAAEIVWVCNGCRDGSADLIRRLAPGARVIELAAPGKAAALQAGDDLLGDLFPRVYLDADTSLAPGDLLRLTAPLRDDSAEMTGALPAFDDRGASALSRAVGACWLALPHAQGAGFLGAGAIGISAAGRRRWNRFPSVMGDDVFMTAMVPADRRHLVREVVSTSSLPDDLTGWVRRRARWRRGEMELARLGLFPPVAPKQRSALLARLLRPRTSPGALAFVAVRCLAGLLARLEARRPVWQPDRRARADLSPVRGDDAGAAIVMQGHTPTPPAGD